MIKLKMQTNIEILPFDVNNASDEEWEKFHTFRKTRYSDKASSGTSSQHQIPDKKYEEILKIPPSKINVLRFNVFLKNVPDVQIGEVYFSYYKKQIPDVDQKVAMVNVSVLASHRRKGYGIILLNKIVELANRYNKTKLLFQTTEEDGQCSPAI